MKITPVSIGQYYEHVDTKRVVTVEGFAVDAHIIWSGLWSDYGVEHYLNFFDNYRRADDSKGIYNPILGVMAARSVGSPFTESLMDTTPAYEETYQYVDHLLTHTGATTHLHNFVFNFNSMHHLADLSQRRHVLIRDFVMPRYSISFSKDAHDIALLRLEGREVIEWDPAR